MKTNDIVRLSTQIAELEKRIKAISATQSVDSNLVNIKEYLVEMKELLTDLNALVTEYTTQTDTHESQIFNLLQRVASLEEQVANLATFDHVQIESDIDSLQASLADLQAQIASIDLSALQTRVDQNESDIAELQTKIGDISGSSASTLESLDQDIANIKGNSTTSLEVLENDISTLQTDVASNEDDIADLNTEISGINESIGDQNTTIANLQSAQNSMSSTISNISTTTNTLSNTVYGLNNRLLTAESNISALSGGTITTSGEDYLSSIQSMDRIVYYYNRKITAGANEFGCFTLKYDDTGLIKLSAILNYTSDGTGEMDVRINSYVNPQKHNIDLATNPNSCEVFAYVDNPNTHISVQISTTSNNVVLKKLEIFAENKNVHIGTHFNGIEANAFDGINYYANYGEEADKIYIYNPTNYFRDITSDISIDIAEYYSNDFLVYPRLIKTESGTLAKDGYYLIGAGKYKVIIMQLNESFEQVNSLYFDCASNHCNPKLFYGEDDLPYILFLSSGGYAKYAPLDFTLTRPQSSNFTLNGTKLTSRRFMSIIPIVNQRLTSESTTAKCYGFFAEDLAGDIYFYDSNIATAEIKLATGYRPRGYINDSGTVDIYYSHHTNKRASGTFSYNSTDGTYTLDIKHKSLYRYPIYDDSACYLRKHYVEYNAIY